MTITVTTPDYESDLLTILAAALPSAMITTPGSTCNAWPGNERPDGTGTGIPTAAYFVQYVTTAYDRNNDGPIRTVTVTVTIRGPKNSDTATRNRAVAVHDAGASFGFNNNQFVGASGTRYFDLAAVSLIDVGPDKSTDNVYFNVDFEMKHAG